MRSDNTIIDTVEMGQSGIAAAAAAEW